MGQVFGQLGGPLLAGEDADGGVLTEPLFGPISKPGADAVIAAQGVAARENQAAGRGLSHETTRNE